MTPNEVKLALLEVLGGGVYLNTFAFVIYILGSLVAIALVARAAAFFGKRGETAAMKRDIETIKANLAQTTAVAEEIKAAVSGEMWLRQKRWEAKWECYSDIIENLGELHALLEEAILLHAKGQIEAFDQKRTATGLAFEKIRRSASRVRLAVSAEVRTALSTFGANWNVATNMNIQEQNKIARDAWMEMADIARHDLFGEPREMSTSPVQGT